MNLFRQFSTEKQKFTFWDNESEIDRNLRFQMMETRFNVSLNNLMESARACNDSSADVIADIMQKRAEHQVNFQNGKINQHELMEATMLDAIAVSSICPTFDERDRKRIESLQTLTDYQERMATALEMIASNSSRLQCAKQLDDQVKEKSHRAHSKHHMILQLEWLQNELDRIEREENLPPGSSWRHLTQFGAAGSEHGNSKKLSELSIDLLSHLSNRPAHVIPVQVRRAMMDMWKKQEMTDPNTLQTYFDDRVFLTNLAKLPFGVKSTFSRRQHANSHVESFGLDKSAAAQHAELASAETTMEIWKEKLQRAQMEMEATHSGLHDINKRIRELLAVSVLHEERMRLRTADYKAEVQDRYNIAVKWLHSLHVWLKKFSTATNPANSSGTSNASETPPMNSSAVVQQVANEFANANVLQSFIQFLTNDFIPRNKSHPLTASLQVEVEWFNFINSTLQSASSSHSSSAPNPLSHSLENSILELLVTSDKSTQIFESYSAKVALLALTSSNLSRKRQLKVPPSPPPFPEELLSAPAILNPTSSMSRRLSSQQQQKVLCLVGPPGVGKTSIARSVASALSKPFYRISLAGLTDCAELRGHRRTYLGALPGKITEALLKAQAEDAVILLDEVDKLGKDHRGDPANVLLELLDPTQNFEFSDDYLGLPLDVSNCLFICTANDMELLHPAVADRLEILTIHSYMRQEKMDILSKHIIPQVLEETGVISNRHRSSTTNQSSLSTFPLVDYIIKKSDFTEKAHAHDSCTNASTSAETHISKPSSTLLSPSCEVRNIPPIAFTEDASLRIIDEWTREPGVRNLRQQIHKIVRRLVTEKMDIFIDLSHKNASKSIIDSPLVIVGNEDLEKLADKPVYLSKGEQFLETELMSIGVVRGLAWTRLGGSTLAVEVINLQAHPDDDLGAEDSSSDSDGDDVDDDKLNKNGTIGNGNNAAKVIKPVSMGSLKVTGSLGSVMMESSQISLSFARAFIHKLTGGKNRILDNGILHLHVPEGATPKDGPSAGITMTSALVSLALNKGVRSDIAMTGEITLTGRILKIGGVREKLIAAQKEGAKTILLPFDNRADVLDLPDGVREGLKIVYVKNYKEAFEVLFP